MHLHDLVHQVRLVMHVVEEHCESLHQSSHEAPLPLVLFLDTVFLMVECDEALSDVYHKIEHLRRGIEVQLGFLLFLGLISIRLTNKRWGSSIRVFNTFTVAFVALVCLLGRLTHIASQLVVKVDQVLTIVECLVASMKHVRVNAV